MSDRPILLDAFCGAGGAAMGYYRVGFEVVGIDIAPQKHYPFRFIQADALEYIAAHGTEYDAIHASPPCQHYTMMQHITKNQSEHADLVDLTRKLLVESGKLFVIENVYKAPLNATLMLCGSMFGLRIIRHRYFESNFLPLLLMPSCNHSDVYDPWHNKGKRSSDKFRLAMAIDWMPDAGGGRRSGTVSQAIPPAYTEFIGAHLLAALEPRR